MWYCEVKYTLAVDKYIDEKVQIDLLDVNSFILFIYIYIEIY